jgi:ABC-type uncharacterized transport system involved in gliding motility auxiliary subunit
MTTDKNRKVVAAQTGLFLLVVAAILVVLNVLSIGANKRWDATKNERFTLSQGSGRLVQNLKEPLLVDAYVTKGLARLDVYVDDLTNLLKEYERAGGGKFQFTIIEAKTEDLKERAKEAGLEPMAFASQAETGDDQAAIAQGYLGLVLKYGSEKDTIPLNPGQAVGLEFLITNKIREIRDKADSIKHKIGVVTGKDELKLTDTNLLPRRGQGGASIQGILGQHFPFYEFVDVDLKDGATEIDATLDGLVITQPQKDYSEKELERVDEFLMRGNKSLAVFASASNLKPNDAKMKAELNTHNLEKLLSGYGLNLKKNLLLDFGAQFQTPVMTNGGIAAVRYPPIAHVADDPRLEGDKRTLDTGFAAFFRLQEVAFPYPSSIELLRDKQPADVKLEAVARTTPNTSELTSDSIDLSLRLQGWEPKPPFAQHVIAAYAEGKLKSAFATAENAKVAAEPSRVLLIASNEYITNPFAYSGNGPELGGQFAMFGGAGGDQALLSVANPYAQRYLTNTVLSVKNTMDWMTGDSDLLAISAKIIAEPNLKYTSITPESIPVDATEEDLKRIEQDLKEQRKYTQNQVTWTLTLLMPALFAAFGVFRWKRRSDKRTQLTLA